MQASIIERLRTDAWRTAGARYNAARRLRQRESVSSASLALFSAAIIIVSLVQALYSDRIGSGLATHLTAITASFGMFALIVSLLEAGARSGERASRLFFNAESLNDFQKRMASAEVDGYSEFLREYKAIKDSLGDNHDPVDDEYFVLAHRESKEFEGLPRGNKVAISLKYRLASIWHLVMIWIAFVIGLFVVFLCQ